MIFRFDVQDVLASAGPGRPTHLLSGGHRGGSSTYQSLRAEFTWPEALMLVEGFAGRKQNPRRPGYGRLLARLRSALAFAAIERSSPTYHIR